MPYAIEDKIAAVRVEIARWRTDFSTELGSPGNAAVEAAVDDIEAKATAIETDTLSVLDAGATSASNDMIAFLVAGTDVLTEQQITGTSCGMWSLFPKMEAGDYLDGYISQMEAVITFSQLATEINNLQVDILEKSTKVLEVQTEIGSVSTALNTAGNILADAGTGSAYPPYLVNCLQNSFPQLQPRNANFHGIASKVKELQDLSKTSNEIYDELLILGKTQTGIDTTMTTITGNLSSLNTFFS